MSLRSFLLSTVAAIPLALFTANSASAVALPPNANLAPTAEAGSLAALIATGTLVGNTTVLTFNAAGFETGTYQARVYREAGGTLTFVYNITNDATSVSRLESVTMGQFAGTTITDAAFDPSSGGTIPPITVSRTLDGNTVKFTYDPVVGIPPGSASETLLLRTTATLFVAGAYSVQDTGVAQLTGFQPAAASVPEPATAALGLLALPLLGAYVLSKKKVGAQV